MNLNSRVESLSIVVGTLAKNLANADSKIKSDLCLELHKAKDAALLTSKVDLADDLEIWIDILGCKNIL